MDLHHPLLKEFPEHREFILWLKVSDEGFRRMFDEYHQVDDTICRIEEQVDFATDQETDELKMKRACLLVGGEVHLLFDAANGVVHLVVFIEHAEIGRASCRERV